MTITPNSGTGPGSITPDGSPVEFYTLLKPEGEAELIAQVVPIGGTVLEIGAGVGRVTHRLVELGFEVVAVDESAEMLAHIQGARTVHARAQDLRLDRRFDAVTLASQLVNTDAAGDLLAAAARHLKPGGALLIQWMPAERHDAWRPGQGRTKDGLTIELADVREVSPGLFHATMRYRHGEDEWTQSFSSRRLTDEQLEAELAEAGLRLVRFLNEERTWVLAVL
ncbi:class I SAM-dependent methyltransferase [Nonomuraea sediminis]|uniref:class I SAM-dependent methyltransferase n=1 Tax=Nonomuraea sediminis TaxID=2835864 RepID=UPI001BDDADAE|nr:class I SAM-dependent methyltransferase [Nonomuraea sediminis]